VTAETLLVERAKGGDDDAFEKLVAPYVDRLYGAARLVLRDPDLAHDVVQLTLIAAWKHLPRLRENDRFEPWLQRLLVTSCYDERRRERRWVAKLRLVPPETTADGDPDFADREVISRALGKLSRDHRLVLVLHYFLDLTPSEIAERLGIPGGTARSRLHYALAELRSAVDAEERPIAGGVA
jgi:RNA polymerase sigma-70 factor (ECF subfamily)